MEQSSRPCSCRTLLAHCTRRWYLGNTRNEQFWGFHPLFNIFINSKRFSTVHKHPPAAAGHKCDFLGSFLNIRILLPPLPLLGLLYFALLSPAQAAASRSSNITRQKVPSPTEPLSLNFLKKTMLELQDSNME